MKLSLGPICFFGFVMSRWLTWHHFVKMRCSKIMQIRSISRHFGEWKSDVPLWIKLIKRLIKISIYLINVKNSISSRFQVLKNQQSWERLEDLLLLFNSRFEKPWLDSHYFFKMTTWRECFQRVLGNIKSRHDALHLLCDASSYHLGSLSDQTTIEHSHMEDNFMCFGTSFSHPSR